MFSGAANLRSPCERPRALRDRSALHRVVQGQRAVLVHGVGAAAARPGHGVLVGLEQNLDAPGLRAVADLEKHEERVRHFIECVRQF